MSDACCAPDEQNRNNLINTPPSSINSSKEVAVAMSNVKGGWFSMGSDNKNVFPGDGEGPVRDIFVDDFDYYHSNSIARASKTMTDCKNLISNIKKTGTEG